MFARRAAFAFLFLALFCATAPAWGDSTVRIVRLSYLDGDVQIDRGAGRGLERAVLNMPVVQGARLSTGAGATAEVEFEDGSTLRLVPDTSVEFRKLVLRNTGQRVSAVELTGGTAYLAVTTKKDEYSISSSGQEVTPGHEGRLRVGRSPSGIVVAVFKGDAEVRNTTGSVRVKKGETLNLDLKNPSKYELAKGLDPDSYDDWNQQRDQYRQTYAANHHDGFNSFYSYGWSDLNYFGNFSGYGSYGTLWRPFGAGMAWDPFADGAWMYYPGAGYTWVSGYPWGWMPYRYGSWMFVPGYGWGWSPATVWNNWYATPVVYNAPPGYVAPIAPVVTRPAPGQTSPRTVVVGSGTITDIRNPIYRHWLTQTRSANPSLHAAGVTPVPAASPVPGSPASRSAATTPARTSTRVTRGTMQPSPSWSRTSSSPGMSRSQSSASSGSAPEGMARSAGSSGSSRSSGGSSSGGSSRSASSGGSHR